MPSRRFLLVYALLFSITAGICAACFVALGLPGIVASAGFGCIVALFTTPFLTDWLLRWRRWQ